MFEKRCYLCGGKLINGRCQDCGLNNDKSLNKKYRLNDSQAAHRMKPEAESTSSGEDIARQKKLSKQKAQKKRGNEGYQSTANVPYGSSGSTEHTNTQYTYTHVPVKKRSVRGQRSAVIGVVFSVIVAAVGVIPSLVSYVREKSYTTYDYETDPYEYVQRELPETGEYFQTELEPGEYKVGVHIPEGAYTVTLESGNGSAYVKDYDNAIYEVRFFGDDEEFDEVEEWDGVRLYAGAVLEVSGDVSLGFVTENGQNGQMISVENPLKETVLVRKGEELEAGKDFPAGVYDLRAVTSWTSVTYTIPLNTDYEDEASNNIRRSKWLSVDDREAVFRNVILTEGTTITPSEADIELKPSEVVMENYDTYYDNY